MSDVPAANIISTTDLDTEFPVPGQDNDSQGFRDNFTVINDNTTSIKARIEDLEANVVRIDSTGSGTYANTNVFEELTTGGTARLINPTLQSHREVKYDIGATSGDVTVDFSNGTYQTIALTGETTLSVNSETIPDSGYYGKIVLHITATGGTQNLLWDNTLTIKFDTGNEGFWDRGDTQTSQIELSRDYVIELWTYQGSTTYFAKYIGEFN